MNSRKIRLIEIFLVVFFIVYPCLKSLGSNTCKEDIKEDYFILNKEKVLTELEETLNKSKEDVLNQEDDINIVGDDFIIVKDIEEGVSRSSISRRNKSIDKIVESAHKELGKPYSYGKTGPDSYDCSGFTYSLYLNELGIELNRSSKDQIENGYLVDKKNLMPGDLVFFNTFGKGVSHVGIYIGGGQMIHASSRSRKVISVSIYSKYFKSKYMGGRRIIE